MATISAVEAIPGQRTDNGENTGKTAAPKPSSPEFKRNYFITNPESRSPTEGAENPDRPDKFKFKGDTREQMRTFLDNFMAENYNARWDRGGEDLLKGRPAAEALFKLLGGEKSGGIEDNALQTKIDAVLKTPEGWVLTKSLVEEDTAIKMMTLGVLAATENPGRTTNPQDIIDQERTALAEQKGTGGRVKSIVRRAGQLKHPGRVGAAIGVGVGIIGQSVDAIPDRITNFTDFLADHPDLVENFGQFFSKADSSLITAATGLAGAGLGWYAGRRRNNSETALNNAHAAAGGLQPAAEALNVIQNNPDLAKYVKRTLKIDVTGLQIDASGRVEVIDQTKVNGDIKGILDQAKTALVVRSLYYRDLGVPPADRTIMPERSFLNNGTIQGGSPEILEQKIQARFRELGDTVDRFGNTRYRPDGSENPLFNQRGENEKPHLDNFLLDDKNRSVGDPWYYRDKEGMPDLPQYDKKRITFKERRPKSTFKRYDKDRQPGDERKFVKREVVERVRDKWGQSEYFDDGTPNPFWGKIDAKGPPANLTDDQIAEFNRLPNLDRIVQRHPWPAGTVDQWGQKPGETGFGCENRKGLAGKVKDRMQGREEKEFSYDNIPGEFIQDRFGNRYRLGNKDNDRNIFFGVMRTHNIPYTKPDGTTDLIDLRALLDRHSPQPENFDPANLIDDEGRDITHPLFGRGKYGRRNALGKFVELTFPPTKTPTVKDGHNKTPLDAKFWTSADPLPPRIFSNYDVRTGMCTLPSGDEIPPWHPLFGYAVRLKVHTTTDEFQVDKWNQRRGEKEAFGVHSPEELNAYNTEANIQKYMDARAAVMADLARDVLVKIDKTPAGDGALLEQKLKERKDGTKVPEKKEKALKKKTELEEDKKILEAKLAAVDAYKESGEKLREAQDDLKTYLRETFGSDAEAEALRDLNRILSGRDAGAEAPLEIKIDGQDHDFPKSIPKQKEEIAKEYNQVMLQIRQENPKEPDETGAEWRARLQPLYDGALDEYNEKLDEVKKQQQLLYSVRGEIEQRQLEIKHQDNAQRTDSEERKKRDEALYPKDDDIVTQINEVLPFVRRFIRDIDRVTIDGLLQVVNKRYEDTKNDPTPEGWPANENNTHREAVVYSLVNIKIDTLSGSFAPDSDRNREEYLRGLLTRTQRDITRTDREANAVDDEEEIINLEVTLDLMNRQGEIFDKTRVVLGNNQSVFKVRPANTSAIPPVTEHVIEFRELSDDEKKAQFTPAEIKAPDTTPLSYFELLNLITGYQDRADRNDYYAKIASVITPEVLEQAFKAAAAPTIERTDSLAQITMKLNKNISAVTALQMHNVFLNVINTLKTKGLALL